MSGRKSIFWAAINSWSNNLLSFALMAILARLVTPVEFGVIALAGLYIAFAQVFINDTVGEALVQRGALDDKHLSSAFWMMLGVGCLFCLAGVLVSEPIARIFDKPDLAFALQLLAPRLILDSLLVVPQGLLIRNLDFKSLALRNLGGTLAGGACGIGVALAGKGGVLALVTQQLVSGILNVVLCIWLAEWRPRLQISFRHGRDLLPYSGNTALWRLCGFLGANIDRILIGKYIDVFSVGYYNMAARIRELTYVSVAGPVISVSLPLLSGKVQNGVLLVETILRISRLQTIVIFPLFIGLSCVARDVVPILFGRQWTPTGPLLEILAVGGLFGSIGAFHSSIIRALNRADWWFRVRLLELVLSSTMLFLLIDRGVVVVAMISAITPILSIPIQLIMVRSLSGLDVTAYLKIHLVPVLATAIMALVVLSIRFMGPAEVTIGRLVVEVIFGGLFYGGSVFVLERRRLLELAEFPGITPLVAIFRK